MCVKGETKQEEVKQHSNNDLNALSTQSLSSPLIFIVWLLEMCWVITLCNAYELNLK